MHTKLPCSGISEEKIPLVVYLISNKAVIDFTANQEEHFKFEMLFLIKLAL